MIYNIKNRSNYTTESRKEKKTCFNAHTGGKSSVLKFFTKTKAFVLVKLF